MDRIAWGTILIALLLGLVAGGAIIAMPEEALTVLGTYVAYLAGVAQRAPHHGRHVAVEPPSMSDDPRRTRRGEP